MATVDSFVLTANQKLIAQSYFDLGDTLRTSTPSPTVEQTMQQARNADTFIRDLVSWLGQAQRGAHYVMAYHRKVAADAFEASTQ